MLINIICYDYYYFNEMNNQYYDMPLQTVPRRKLASPQSIPPFQQYITPLIHNMKQVHTEDTLTNYKYDLPCQRQNNQYVYIRSQENRPAILKNVYQQVNKYSVTSRAHQIQPSKYHNHTKSHHQQARTKVTSIYERLLQQNKQFNHVNHQKDIIVTQATFKPKQLQKQLARHHSSEIHKHSLVKNSSSKKLNNTKIQRSVNSMKKLHFGGTAKTKYQQILEQHFNTKIQSKTNNQKIMSPDQIRLSKICGKNSTIMKLKQRLQPMSGMFCSKQKQNNEKRIQTNVKIQQCKQIQKNKLSLNSCDKKILKQLGNQAQNKKNQKGGQSERWMSLSFYQRQQRMISNRKQKQTQGKKTQLQKQIKPCTFKPQIVTKSKSQKLLHPERQSYLEQYYDRLYKKY